MSKPQKLLSVLLLASMLLIGASCSNTKATTETGKATTETWKALNNTFSAWYDESKPDTSMGIDVDSQNFYVGKTAEGKDIFALLRLPLKGTWLADEISEARLFLKLNSETAPSKISIGFVSNNWDYSNLTRAEAVSAIDSTSIRSFDVKNEGGAWVSVSVKDFVRTWLSGERPNYGFALFGEIDGEEYTFISDVGESEAEIPYLEVTGQTGERAKNYGKFAYTETPFPGALTDEGGNCMSYALRDTNMILIDDLAADFDSMDQIYTQLGESGVLTYFTELVKNYVDEHKTGLKISSFRQLDSFDSKIDPSVEYRIAMRIGCKVWNDVVDLGGKRNFDYHFWAQLNDGKWAQKFPLDTSEIIPCSAANLSPEKYPWDCAMMWTGNSQNYYTSKVVYFAVTKSTDEFTQHKG
ncbi:MAG: DNRLRE domain-containing protein [Oscillospiraceae bacterium]|jgi:hypothetical protein|nr:DNRLRE domain-containing protein [Oscillospiraceae bacterium]